jgi:hypothetical protein
MVHDILQVLDVEADMRVEQGWNISQVLIHLVQQVSCWYLKC